MICDVFWCVVHMAVIVSMQPSASIFTTTYQFVMHRFVDLDLETGFICHLKRINFNIAAYYQ